MAGGATYCADDVGFSTGSAYGTYLTITDAATTYFLLNSSTTLLTTSSATATYLTRSSATLTYLNNAAPISSSLLDTSSITKQGNTFNTGSSLVQLSGSLIPNSLIDSSSVTKRGNSVNGASQLVLTDSSSFVPNANIDGSSITKRGNTFNGATQLVLTDSSSFVPNANIDSSSVTKKGSNVVDKTSSESISGQKTFNNAIYTNGGITSTMAGGSDFIDFTGNTAGTVNIRLGPSGATSNAARVRAVVNGTNTGIHLVTAGTARLELADSSTTINGTLYDVGLTASAQANALCYNSTTGEFTYNSGVTTCLASALRYKENIKTLTDNMLAKVLLMKPVQFNFKSDPTKEVQVGFIAEDVQKIDKRLVATGSDGKINGFNYEQYTAILTGAIQDLTKRLDASEKTITKLTKDLDDLKKSQETQP